MISEEPQNQEQEIVNEEGINSEIDEDEIDKLDIIPFKLVLSEPSSFLNVILNSFFYKKEFMNFFETEEPSLDDRFRLIYELQSTFEQMRRLTRPEDFKKITKERRIIDSSYIKHELSYQFNGKFYNATQSGYASDILNIFFNALHVYFNDENDIMNHQTSKCINKNCLSHTLAYVDIASQIYCVSCNKKGTLYKYPFDCYYYPIDTNLILEKLYFKEAKNEEELYLNKLFQIEKTIQNETFQDNENETFVCECRKVDKKNFKNNLIMLESHKYFTTYLLWKEPPKYEDVCRIYITFPQHFMTTDIFHIYNDNDIKEYILNGLIVVNASNHRHVSFFIHEEEGAVPYSKLQWYCSNVDETKIMHSYQEVLDWCILNNYYPILLFYMYLDKEKISQVENIPFTFEQLKKYIHHGALIDKVNSTNYTNMKLKKEIFRPDLSDIYLSYDEKLLKYINEIKQDESKGKKKFNFAEELQREMEKEALEESKNKDEKKQVIPKYVRRPKNLEKFNQDKKDFFLIKLLKFLDKLKKKKIKI